MSFRLRQYWPTVLVLLAACSEQTETVEPRDMTSTDVVEPTRQFVTIDTERFAGWPSEPSYRPLYRALDPMVPIDAAAVETVANVNADPYRGIPRSEGFELVYGYCSGCHSIDVVKSQRLSEEGWDAMLDWMVSEQGMPQPSNEVRRTIHTYLSSNFK
ncbi:MAG: hypothetical protein AAF351_05925 [Pseudomonadota bacterium]